MNNILGIELPANKYQCPFCKENLSGKPSTNFSLLSIIEETNNKNAIQFHPCSEHKLMPQLVCIDCKQTICPKCSLKGEHKDHQIDLIGDFYDKVLQKKKSFNESVETKQHELKNQQKI